MEGGHDAMPQIERKNKKTTLVFQVSVKIMECSTAWSVEMEQF
jgi:hypothetical protein